MALGAGKGDVLAMILRQASAVIGTGLALGLAFAVAGARLLASMLYGVSSTDPRTFAAITLLLAAVALLASYLAARRSTRVDPVITLRGQ
jgi:ABC-type antimicrobial peptide transport system permease subunit